MHLNIGFVGRFLMQKHLQFLAQCYLQSRKYNLWKQLLCGCLIFRSRMCEVVKRVLHPLKKKVATKVEVMNEEIQKKHKNPWENVLPFDKRNVLTWKYREKKNTRVVLWISALCEIELSVISWIVKIFPLSLFLFTLQCASSSILFGCVFLILPVSLFKKWKRPHHKKPFHHF